MTDAKDFKILRHLFQEPFASYQRIGEPIGLSGVSVKARMVRLERDGVIQGMWGLPAPETFGRHGRLFVYAKVARPDRAMALARKTDPIARAAVGHERSFEVTTYARTPDEGAPPELVKRLGEPDFSGTMRITVPQERSFPLSPLDWRILLPLVRQPRSSVQKIAEITGLSRKTVRRHRDDLFRRGVFRALPLLAGARSPGLVIYRLFIRSPSITFADRQRILGTLPDTYLAAWTEGPPGLWLAGGAPTMAAALHDRDRAERLLGVTHAEFDVFVRNEYFPERIEGWIREELAKWDARRRPAKPAR